LLLIFPNLDLLAIISLMENPFDFTYYQTREFPASLCGQKLRVISKPGLPHWDKVTPAVQLLAETISLRKGGQVMLLGCGNGALGVALSRQGRASDLRMADTSQIAMRVAKQTMAANGYANVPVEPLQYPFPAEAYQTVVINLPKGRKLARRWLVEVWGALQLNGELYLAGANPEGIQSVIHDAEGLFGNATVLNYRKGCRVARMVKQSEPGVSPRVPPRPGAPGQEVPWAPGPEVPWAPGPRVSWAAEPGIARGSWIEFSASVCGGTFALRSLPGVFSFDHLDEGTALLLQQLTREWVQGRRVLDFGCGFGLIGMAAAWLGAAWVDLLDVDLSAVAAAQENCLGNMIPNVQVRPSDVLDAIGPERYDLILSNPPFHAGKLVEYSMAHTFITHSRQILNPDGRLVLVANRFIRYDRLMKDVFGNVVKLIETGKYYVLESVR
jgi:16S rRNA (guanine1207-N2)-methyltransferase